MKKFSVLFVCLGNICRSPSAEAVLRHLLTQSDRKLETIVKIDSAGIDAFHEGQSPDSRAQHAAKNRGYDLSGIRARKITQQDFDRYDLILAMDRQVMSHLQDICPVDKACRLTLFMSFCVHSEDLDIPDPYYGGREGFERVLDLIEAASEGLIRAVEQQTITPHLKKTGRTRRPA